MPLPFVIPTSHMPKGRGADRSLPFMGTRRQALCRLLATALVQSPSVTRWSLL